MTYILWGAYGHLIVDASTGVVEEYVPQYGELPEYADMYRVDVDEWRTWATAHVAVLGAQYGKGGHIDVLDVGYWSEDGSYSPPEHEHRAWLLDAIAQGTL